MNNEDLIIAMYKNNISIKKISLVLNLPLLEIFNYLRSNNIGLRSSDRYLEKDKKICDLFLQGKQVIDIAREEKVGRHTIVDILIRNNIPREKKLINNLDPRKADRNKKIIELYESGLSGREVASNIGVCVSTVFKVLNAFNASKRPQHQPGHSKGTSKNRKYHFNLTFFSEIDTEEKAYWLGFLYADGYVSNTGYMTLSLKKSDFEHIKKLRKSMDPTETVPIKETKDAFSILFSSVQMADDLIRLGCHQKKSLDLTFPTSDQVPKSLIHHFMRGYFDGDGCITASKTHSPVFSVLGTPAFLDEYETLLLENMSNRQKTKRLHKNSWNANTESIVYGGKLRISDIFNYLYKDATIYLERKYRIFNSIISRLKTKM